MNYIKGTFRKTIFKSEQGYVIGLFKIRETDYKEDYLNKTITFTGVFHELIENEKYIFYGKEIDHPRYGLQFEVKTYEQVKKETTDEIIEFLASDLFKGIGIRLATRIVNVFKEETIDKIKEGYENLLLVPRMTEKKALIIYETLKKHEASSEIILELQKVGFNASQSFNIYNKYQDKTLEMIEENIYDLIDNKLIDFLLIDKIRHYLKIEDNDERRLKALIMYAIKTIGFNNGDVYVCLKEILMFLNRYVLETTIEEIEYLLTVLNQEQQIIIEDDKYYLSEVYQDEEYIVDRLLYLNSLAKNDFKNIDNEITKIEKTNKIKYNVNQQDAIKRSFIDNILIITGGPGTGKTTIIKGIINLYQNTNLVLDEDIILLAPTGRASKRMSEITEIEAMTIHRFLKWNKETDNFSVNEYNKLAPKVVIIDEASMIDNSLLASLLRGLSLKTKIIIIGDYYQLPSVREGQILKDLVESEVINLIQLDEIYRQEKDSYIISLAGEIREKNLSKDFMKKKSDYCFLEMNNYLIKENLKVIIEKTLNKYSLKDIQVLIPMYKGENGIDNVNKYLQDVFNPLDKEKNEIEYDDVIYREGDKVIQLNNLPEENIFNGDIGYIISCRNQPVKELVVDFDDNIVTYKYKNFNSIKHAYAISIHKAQGSEFKVVMLPFTKAYNRMLYNKLVYTGISRAKEKLILLGNSEVFRYAVNNDKESMRKTTLKDKLIEKSK